MTTRLQELLGPPRDRDAEKIAIRCGQRQITYAELDRQVRQVAAGMQANGVSPGERVAWLLPNCLEAVITTLACYRIGAVSLPLNYRYVAPEIQYVCDLTRPVLLISHADRATVVDELEAAIDTIPRIVVGDGAADCAAWSTLLGNGPTPAGATLDDNSPALILFTSGSTGRPKGVLHSHGGVWAAISHSRETLDFRSDDVVLVGKPISHAGGLQTQLLPALLAGAEVILTMKPSAPEAAALIERYAVTEYGMMASDLLDFIEFLEESGTRLPTLKNGIGSGDSVPVELHHRFRDLFGWEVMEGSGMTEVGRYYAINPRYGMRKWGSLGLPTPGTELRIVHDDGSDVLEGEVGEIILRSESATIGYWDNPIATAELFRDGWLHSGDLARYDEDGYVWFVGRKKLIIVRRGSNIAPAEVENVLDEHPGVHASLVVGIPDPRDGHVPVAWIAPLHHAAPPTEKELKAYVAERLAPYQSPVSYLFVDELPRNSTGKFDRHRLQEMAEQALTRSPA